MKKFISVLIIALTLLMAGAVYAEFVNCPIDNMSMYFTGKTQFEWGKLLYEYRCPAGHTAWVVK